MTIKNDEGLNGELVYLKKDDAHHCSAFYFSLELMFLLPQHKKHKGNTTSDGLQMTMIDKKQMVLG
jgi:hypothetical protein